MPRLSLWAQQALLTFDFLAHSGDMPRYRGPFVRTYTGSFPRALYSALGCSSMGANSQAVLCFRQATSPASPRKGSRNDSVFHVKLPRIAGGQEITYGRSLGRFRALRSPRNINPKGSNRSGPHNFAQTCDKTSVCSRKTIRVATTGRHQGHTESKEPCYLTFDFSSNFMILRTHFSGKQSTSPCTFLTAKTIQNGV